MPEASEYIGTVTCRLLGSGSKSQRMGFVLQSKDGLTLPLEVEGWGPFKQGVFTPFEGHVCNVEAVLVGSRLLARSIRALDDTDRRWSLIFAPGRSCNFCGRLLPSSITDHCPNCGARVS